MRRKSGDGGSNPPPLPHSCLDALVGRSHREQFLSEYLYLRTYHPAQPVEPGLLRALALDVTSFKKACRALEPGVLRAYARSEGAAQEVVIAPEQIDELFWAGMTIAASGFQRAYPPCFSLVRALRREIGFTGAISVSVFLSPPDSGYSLHFDSYSVFNLQLQGTKDWRFATKPAIRDPLVGAKLEDVPQIRENQPWFRPTMPSKGSLVGTTMAPGSLLYMPAGTWHGAAASSPSLSMSLNFEAPSRSRRLADQLHGALNQYEEWRLGSGRSTGRPPRRPIDGILALAEQLEAKLNEELPSPQEPPAGQPATKSRPPSRRDIFEVVHPFRFSVAKGGRDDIDVVTSRRGFSLDADALPMLEKLAATERFVAGDLMHWSEEQRMGSSWSEARSLLSELVGLGLVRRAQRRGKRIGRGDGRAN